MAARRLDDAAKVIDWLAEITADCPKKLTRNMYDQCGADARIWRRSYRSRDDGVGMSAYDPKRTFVRQRGGIFEYTCISQ
jgi:hypothetical protein